jgi:hypothetical protein
MVVAFLAVSSVVLVPSAQGDEVRMSVAITEGQVLNMGFSVDAGPHIRQVTAMALEVNQVHQGPIYILINENLRFGTKVSLQRMADHFNNELPIMGSDITATIIDLDGLPKVFSDPHATLVCGPGAALPDYYAMPSRQWVEEGGLWVGVGNGSIPFIYSQDNAGTPNATMRLDFAELEFRGGEGTTVTPMADALGLEYVAPGQAFLLSDLENLGGASIGFQYDRGRTLATAGIIHLGQGSLIVLGGNMTAPPMATSEEVVSWDLEKILLLNIAWWSGDMRYQVVEVDDRGVEGNVLLPLSGGDYVVCGLFSTSDSFNAFKVQRISVGRS